jgi:centrosomal protein CEP120
MTKNKEKYLLVVSFLEGHNFPRRDRTKFLIEAKFDKEQLSTDLVDHGDIIEINQELAWELDKKSLQMHRLQRSCIKANCFAVGDSFKEPIGYFVLDVRSASDNDEVKKASLNFFLILSLKNI